MSRITRTSNPAVAKLLTADSRPDPGPATCTETVRSPLSFALLAAVRAACCAAKGVPFLDPRKPSDPALDQEIVLPTRSVMVTMVLLKVAWICTIPSGMCFRSRFLNVFFFVVFAAFAIVLQYPAITCRPSSCWPQCRGVDLSGCARWCGCAGRARANRDGVAIRGSIQDP